LLVILFHREGEYWYGKTGQGKLLAEAEARKAGYRSAHEGAPGQRSATRAPGVGDHADRTGGCVRGMRRVALTVVFTLGLGGYAWASSPTEQLRTYTDQVMKALENPTLTAPARLEAVRAVAGQAFDVTETAKRALGLHWQPRTSAERAEFVQLFRDLLERGYLSRIGEYGGEQIKYVSEKIDGDYAVVRALIVTKNGTQVPVESRLLQKEDRWLIYDVLVENVSLIASYRSQFDRVIRTTSYQELVRRLKGPGTS
jgi:phospholipid transport system substrate-binding protein